MPVDEAEQAWIACRKGVEGELGGGASDRRIYSIRYQHNGKTLTATVGKLDPYDDRERVMAIIEAGAVYKICCAVRGFVKIGDTPMAGAGSVIAVEYFGDAISPSDD